jgi:hypothetical protein
LTIEIAVTGSANSIGGGNYRVVYHEKGWQPNSDLSELLSGMRDTKS